MDKIWDRKSFEVGRHWPLWRGRKNRPRRTDKSRTLKEIIKSPHTKVYDMYNARVYIIVIRFVWKHDTVLFLSLLLH